jgi:hypothetical protein
MPGAQSPRGMKMRHGKELDEMDVVDGMDSMDVTNSGEYEGLFREAAGIRASR